MIQKVDKAVVIPFDIQQPAGLVVKSELGEGQNLKQLLKRADSARQGDECIGQLRHVRLTFVHRAHHPKLTEPRVGDFFVNQRLRNDANGRPACIDHCIGDNTHQTNAGPTIDQFQVAPRKCPAKTCRTSAVGSLATRVRATEHTDSLHTTSP